MLFQGQPCYALCKYKGYHVSEMHAIAAGSTTGVQEEGLALLIPIEDFVQLPLEGVNTRKQAQNLCYL